MSLVEPRFKVTLNPDENGPAAWRKQRDRCIGDAGGMCQVRTEACTVRARTAHHIRGRRIPNPHTKDNLVATCHECHNGSDVSIHAQPEWARLHGFMETRTA